MRKILAILIALTFVISGAFSLSVSGNFDVNSDCIYPAQTTWSLYNGTSGQQNYSITAYGTNAGWINSNGIWIAQQELSVSIPAYSRIDVFSFIKPPCNVPQGSYLINVKISGNDTITKTVTVQVKNSTSIDLNVVPNYIAISQCGENTFNVSVSNYGKTAESIGLGLDGIPYNWFDFNQRYFVIDRNSQQKTILKIKVPCNAAAKNYPLAIKAAIAGTDVVLQKQATLNVATSQNLSIILPKVKSCAETRSSEKISIKNNSSYKDSITLSLEGPSFVSISQQNLDLNAGEQKDISLDVSSTVPARETKYTLKAVSKTFARTVYESSTIERTDCYAAEIQNINVPSKLCLKSGNGILGLSINNRGTSQIPVKASAVGINTKPQSIDFNLAAGEKRPLNFEILTENEKAGKKEFQITLKSGFLNITRNYAIEFENCNDLNIDSNAFNAITEIEAGKSDAKTIIASNNGTKNLNVRVLVKTAPSWAYIKPENAAIASGQKAEFYLYISPPKDTPNKNYSITLEFDSNAITITKNVAVKVSGGINAEDSKPKIEINASNVEIKDYNGIKKLNAVLEIKNTGLIPIKINSISSLGDYNAVFEFDSNQTINFGSDANGNSNANSIDANVSIYLDSNFSSAKIVLPLRINSNVGTIDQNVEIQASKNPFLAGLLVLADWRILLTFGVILAIILIAMFLIARKSDKENKPKSESKNEANALKAIWEEQKDDEKKSAGKIEKNNSKPSSSGKKKSK